jgi:hypothetical protein
MTPTSFELGIPRPDFAPFSPQSIFQQNSQKIGALFQPAAVFLFCRKIKLQTFAGSADSLIQFYRFLNPTRTSEGSKQQE